VEAENQKTSAWQRWRKPIRLIILVASLALLIWLLDLVGWDKIADYAVRLGWTGMIIIIVLGVAEHLLDAMAFQKAIPENISLFYVHVANQAGALLNRFIPWEAGEVLKGALLGRRVTSSASISGTIAWNYMYRFTKPIATLIAAAIAWMFGAKELSGLAGWMVLASVLSFAPYMVFKVLVHIGLARTAVWLMRVIRFIRRDPERIIKKATEIDEVVRTFSKRPSATYYLIIILQLMGRVVSWVTLYLVLRFTGQDYDFVTTGMIWAGFQVMGYLVSLLPSRLGTTEASGWLLFKLLGLDPAVGLMAQCIMSVKSIITTGGAALLVNFLRAGNKDDQNQS
jgi:uncharacterized protein (TIRG00374 family)